MKRPRQSLLRSTNMIMGVPSSIKKQILQTDETFHHSIYCLNK